MTDFTNDDEQENEWQGLDFTKEYEDAQKMKARIEEHGSLRRAAAIEEMKALDRERAGSLDEESFDDYREINAEREAVGDELLEVAQTESDDVPQYVEPHHIFADGTRVALQGVSPLAVDYLQTVETNKPVPPQTLQGKYRPEPPERIKTTDKGEDVVYLDYEDSRYKKDYQAWLNDRNIKKRMLPDENDAKYLLALQEWKEARERKLIRYLAINGVKDNPPYDWISEATAVLPENFSDNDAKYLWLAEKMKTGDEISRFYQAVAGVTMPTQEGIEDSKNDSP